MNRSNLTACQSSLTATLNGTLMYAPFTGKDPRKGWRTPLNKNRYSEQRDAETRLSYFVQHRSLCRFDSSGTDPRKGWRTPLNKNRYSEQRDIETGLSYFGARYYNADLLTGWLSVDPMADKYPSLSPCNYCAGNPVKLVDPDGSELTDFKAADGALIKHIDDGSDAVFVLQNTGWDEKGGRITKKSGNAYFKYESGNIENNNIKTVIDFSQDFVKEQYTSDGSQTYCNFAASFIVESFMSACVAKGLTIDGDATLFHNTASVIYSRMKPNTLYGDAVRLARTINSSQAYLALGAINGHVVTFTTESDGKNTILNIGGRRGNTYQDGNWLNGGDLKPKFYTIGAFRM